MQRPTLVLSFLFLRALLFAGVSQAQFDGGVYPISQDHRVVGVLWVPDRLPGACQYQEHWYLFSDYLYPGSDQPIETVLRSEPETRFETLDQFLAAMSDEHPGGRHITTVAIEHREDCP